MTRPIDIDCPRCKATPGAHCIAASALPGGHGIPVVVGYHHAERVDAAIGENEKRTAARLEMLVPMVEVKPRSDTWSIAGLPGVFTRQQADALAKQEVARRRQWDEHYAHVDAVTKALLEALDRWEAWPNLGVNAELPVDYDTCRGELDRIAELRKLVKP